MEHSLIRNSLLLTFDQKMNTLQHCLKTASLDCKTIESFDAMFDELVYSVACLSDSQCANAYNLMFRYLFYIRSIRTAGKKTQLIFYYLFEKLYGIFPKTCVSLLSLVPEFGYFGDLNYLIEKMGKYPDIVMECCDVYRKHLNADCELLWGKPLPEITLKEASEMSQRLNPLSREQLGKFIDNKQFSLAAKWFIRKDNRKNFVISVYSLRDSISVLESSDNPEERKIALGKIMCANATVDNILSTITLCLRGKDTNYRTLSDIQFASPPVGFNTKYASALVKENLKQIPDETRVDTGNRFVHKPDRVMCRQPFIRAILDNKSPTQNIERLSHIVYSNLCDDSEGHKIITKTLSDIQRKVIASQWNDTIGQINLRNLIPVIDTSGSMVSERVQHIAIGLGVMASQRSTLPGCLISFSERPEVFHLNMKGDVFDHFLTIANGPMGFNTNIDATYRALLDTMVDKKVQETEVTMLFLTDGEYDEQITEPTTFMDRLEKAYTEKQCCIPRTIFWNLNDQSRGFPATSISKGVQLVSGYSQSLMLSVFTGNNEYNVQMDGSTKIEVKPHDSFLNELNGARFDKVSLIVASTGEGCFKHLNHY